MRHEIRYNACTKTWFYFFHSTKKDLHIFEHVIFDLKSSEKLLLIFLPVTLLSIRCCVSLQYALCLFLLSLPILRIHTINFSFMLILLSCMSDCYIASYTSTLLVVENIKKIFLLYLMVIELHNELRVVYF